jgi:hypothetical protein
MKGIPNLSANLLLKLARSLSGGMCTLH